MARLRISADRCRVIVAVALAIITMLMLGFGFLGMSGVFGAGAVRAWGVLSAVVGFALSFCIGPLFNAMRLRDGHRAGHDDESREPPYA